MEATLCLILLLNCIIISVSVSINRLPVIINADDDLPRAENSTQFPYIDPISNEEILKQDNSYWVNVGETILKRNVQFREEVETHKVAKNIIVFLGDGMGISTVTAARIYKGQQKFGVSGEEYDLTFDKFPNAALVKTYSVDMQVPDSAATATALFTGIKTRYEALSVDVNADNATFDKDVYERSKVDSFMVWAQEANKDTGIITTTRITHATPGATYAHANNRYWECDSELPIDAKGLAKDIARQLVEDAPGKNFKVILGGGQQQMGHTTEYTEYCTRGDGLNLTSDWAKNRAGSNFILATNNEHLDMVNDDTEYLMGIFAPDHMPYELVRDRSPTGTPSLTEMTRKALQILKKSENGFALLIEGGLIDQAHHKNYARLAMEEAAEFDSAIELVLNETGPETLILVTADHSHSFTMNGYSKRGNDIMGYTDEAGEPDRPFLTLAYANGPGFNYQYQPDNTSENTFPWRDTRTDENRLTDPYYRHVGAFYSKDETHGGEDVALYATGPQTNLIRGVVEQNYMAHFISYAACIGPQASLNPACNETTNGATTLTMSLINFGGMLFVALLMAV